MAVAGAETGQEGRLDFPGRDQVREEGDVAPQSPARIPGPEAEIRPLADARIAPQCTNDIGYIGSDRLTDSGDLVCIDDRGGQEYVQGVFRHLGRLDLHPLDRRSERVEKCRDDRPTVRVLHANNNPLRLGERVDGSTQSQVLRAIGECHGTILAQPLEGSHELARASDGQLR